MTSSSGNLSAPADVRSPSPSAFPIARHFTNPRPKEEMVLAVDDDSRSLYILRRFIEKIGCTVITAEGGSEALAIATEAHPSLILLDVSLPEMDGFQVLHQIKSDPDLSDIPVIMITGLDNVQCAVACIEMGAADYIIKPVEPPLLQARVAAQLEHEASRKNEMFLLEKLRMANLQLEHRVEEQVVRIEESVGMERRLAREKEEVVEEGALRERFLALVSHDLRSPLTSIIGALKMIATKQGDRLDAPYQKFLGSSVKSAELMMSMIDDLLNIERVQGGHVKLRRDIILLRNLVDNAGQSLAFMAREQQITIVNDIPADTSVVIDYQMLLQVVQNILSNAIKFTPAGGSITIQTSRNSDGGISLSSCDTGTGINEDILPNLFCKDIRTTFTGLRGERGNGLGLPLCKEIMEVHNGAIRVESKEGEGSTFYIDFPKINSIRALVIDDDINYSFILSSMITTTYTGSEVAEVPNGTDALLLIESGNYDIIITDLQMPEMDGFELIERLKGAEATKELPILAITAYTNSYHHERALSLGADRVLVKPVPEMQLLSTIGKLAKIF